MFGKQIYIQVTLFPAIRCFVWTSKLALIQLSSFKIPCVCLSILVLNF